ncbi:hypothetical protein IEQ34_014556 [Dendrobium chrysotoxum]|uniref:Hyaluronan/mRNA-binding protein domain-containing protein n=1 Tax=Dendrobium chrysotoxum TaxID=161865 RepID=A0AAV7GMF9_DENCH|nr:hypothetical protein IEQ34_014556 [Dendrobium chrysotoxum]
MAMENPFDLLKLSIIKAALLVSASAAPSAKLPSKPLPPAQLENQGIATQHQCTVVLPRGKWRCWQDLKRDRGSCDPPQEAFRGGHNGVVVAKERFDPGRPPRRVYERRSGAGRGFDMKRDGAGRDNWGTTTDDFIAQETEKGVNLNEKDIASEKLEQKEGQTIDESKDKRDASNEAGKKKQEYYACIQISYVKLCAILFRQPHFVLGFPCPNLIIGVNIANLYTNLHFIVFTKANPQKDYILTSSAWYGSTALWLKPMNFFLHITINSFGLLIESMYIYTTQLHIINYKITDGIVIVLNVTIFEMIVAITPPFSWTKVFDYALRPVIRSRVEFMPFNLSILKTISAAIWLNLANNLWIAKYSWTVIWYCKNGALLYLERCQARKL